MKGGLTIGDVGGVFSLDSEVQITFGGNLISIAVKGDVDVPANSPILNGCVSAQYTLGGSEIIGSASTQFSFPPHSSSPWINFSSGTVDAKLTESHWDVYAPNITGVIDLASSSNFFGQFHLTGGVEAAGSFNSGVYPYPMEASMNAEMKGIVAYEWSYPAGFCLLYTSPSPRDQRGSRMPSSA